MTIDSLLIVNWLQGAYESCMLVHNMFVAIKESLARDKEVKIEHVHREWNRATNCLASMSMMHDHGDHLY